MKKQLTLFMLLLTCIVNAQSFFGIQHDNYAGVNAVMSNPANIVDSRFRTDINLISGDINFTNSYYSFSLNELFNDNLYSQENTTNTSGSNSLYTKVDILGPSFMFNITKIQLPIKILVLLQTLGENWVERMLGLFLIKKLIF
jgi:hypothetical protein